MCIRDRVAGAGFKVYLISDLTQVKNGKLKPSNGQSYTANDFKNYDFSKEQVAVTYEKGKMCIRDRDEPECIEDRWLDDEAKGEKWLLEFQELALTEEYTNAFAVVEKGENECY